MMKLVIEEGKKGTRLPAIMKAAVRLFVKKGINGTTIKDIASKAGVAEGALYRHFKSKEDLAWNLFAENLKRFTTQIENRMAQADTLKGKLDAYIGEIFDEFERDRDLFRYMILVEHVEMKNYKRDFKHPGHVLEELIRSGQKSGVFIKKNHYLLLSMVLGGLHRMCVLRMYGRLSKPLGEHQDDVVELSWRTLAAN